MKNKKGTKKSNKKDVKKNISRLLNFFLPILPFAAGMISYYPFYKYETAEKYPVLAAIYSSLKLYAGSTEGSIKLTLLLHLARFAAMYFSLSIIIRILDKSKKILNYFKAGFENNYIVYGGSVHAKHLCDSIGKLHCIKGGDKDDEFIDNGRCYVLMLSDDNANLEFYAKHYEQMKNSRVYIQLENIRRQNITRDNIITFSISECCARLYWRKYYPVKSEKIGIIGFGSIGQNILTFGLQMNIIDPKQHFEYHIWGKSEEFRSLYKELDRIDCDELVFHGTDPFTDAELISECDRVIICSDDPDNMELLSKLMFCTNMTGTEIYIYSPDERVVRNIYDAENIHCFGKSEEVADMDVIINQRTLENAVKQHEFYTEKYGGEPWNKQSSFIRYSNISSADYLYVIERLYNENKTSLETIAELEHIRWCRYYYLNNWRYGKVRDNENRKHNCLIPYSKLTEEEKLKDIESIKVKLGK